MRREVLVESKDAEFELTQEQGEALAELGRKLASDRSWWGEDPDQEEAIERSVIHCRPLAGGRWRIRVRDAVGIVAVGGFQLEVRPKVPLDHFLYLLSLSGRFPRSEEMRVEARPGEEFWELLARWFLVETERVLRRDLVRDYVPMRDRLHAVRGRVDPIGLAQSYYSGRLDFPCEFEEFQADTPLNRILNTAARRVSGATVLGRDVRRRARRVTARMDQVGDLRLGDLHAASIERRTLHYREAVLLARHILATRGRIPLHGGRSGSVFLVRTPDAVEAGIRTLLQQRLSGQEVRKQRLSVVGSKVTFNPDLVFDEGLAVGDVKYKLTGNDWARGDLNQAIAFATVADTTHAAVINFRRPEQAPWDGVQAGPVTVSHLWWLADEKLEAEEAADRLAESAASWLEKARDHRAGLGKVAVG